MSSEYDNQLEGVGELLIALSKISPLKLSHLLEDPLALKRLLGFVESGCEGLPEESVSVINQNECRRTLGENYFNIDQWYKSLGYEIPDESSKDKVYAQLPHKERVRTFQEPESILIPGPPEDMTIVDFIEDEKFGPSLKKIGGIMQNGTLDNQRVYDPVMIEEVRSHEWISITKSPIANSFGKSELDQRSMINVRTQFRPNIAQFVYAIIGYQIATGKTLFANCYVRVSTTSIYHQKFWVGNIEGQWSLGGGHIKSDEDTLSHTGTIVMNKLESLIEDLEFLS